MSASYPISAKSFSTKVDNIDLVQSSHINDIQDEVAAIEAQLIAGGVSIATATPTANAVPKAGATGKLAVGWMMQPQFYLLITPLISTSFDGDAFSTTAKTLIDLSAVFGAPAGIKAVLLRAGVHDSGSAGGNFYIRFAPTNAANIGPVVTCGGLTNDMSADAMVTIPCDANGDIYYQIVASGAGTLAVVVQIWGYWL